MSIAGNPKRKGALAKAPAKCSPDSTKLTVRCCRDGGGKGFTPGRGKGCKKLNYEAAKILCEAKNARLCTKKELSAGLTGGTGCGADKKRTWTSDNKSSGVKGFGSGPGFRYRV